MVKAQRLISMPVISVDDGRQLGRVRNLVIDPEKREVTALLIEQKGWFKELRAIPYVSVKSIGKHAITIDKASSVERLSNLPHVAKLVKNSTKLVGIKAITADGTVLGIVEGYTFDPETGKISSLLLRGKTMKGILTLHISEVTTFGAQSIIVKPDSATRLTREAIPWSERLAQLTTEWTKKLREAFKH